MKTAKILWQKKITALCAAMLLLTLAGPACAGVTIHGDSWSAGGSILSSDEYARSLSTLERIIRQEVGNLGQAILRSSAAEQELAKFNNEALITALKEMEKIRKEEEIKEKLTGENAQPPNLCDMPEVAARMQSSTKTQDKMRESVSASTTEWTREFTRPAKAMDQWAKLDLEKIKPEAMFEKTMSQEQLAHIQTVVDALVNPNPIPKREVPLNNPLDQKVYEQERTLDYLRRGQATATYADILAFHTPTADLGTQLLKIAKEMGQKDTPYIENGKASEAAYYHYMVASRISNPNWYTKMSTASEVALMREQVILQAHNLAMQERTYQLLEKMAGLLANMQTVTLDNRRTAMGLAR